MNLVHETKSVFSHTMRRKYVGLVVLAMAASTMLALPIYAANASLTSTTLSENFDGMAATKILPTGWTTSNKTAAAGSVDNNATTLTSSSGGGSYSFAVGTDVAIGYLNSGSFTSPRPITFGFTNNTGGSVTSLTLGWDYEKYRSGTRAWNWTFASSTDNLTFSPVAAGNFGYAADGTNTVASFPPIVNSISGVTISGLNIPTGSSYYL